MKEARKTGKNILLAASMSALVLCLQSTAAENSAENNDDKESGQKHFLEIDFETLRDPFWPIGWRPEPEVPEQERREQQIKKRIQWPKLKLKGATDRFAIIEGFGIVEEGKEISAARNGIKYTWKINQIDKDKVDIRKLRTAPLR